VSKSRGCGGGPVLPWLTDGCDQLDAALAELAAAGATSATVLPLHLRPSAREWYLAWLARDHPQLVGPYQRLYAGGAYVPQGYLDLLANRVQPLLARNGFDHVRSVRERAVADDRPADRPPTQLGLL